MVDTGKLPGIYRYEGDVVEQVRTVFDEGHKSDPTF
jgi:hypothetical protein